MTRNALLWMTAVLALPALAACENGGTDPEDRVPARVEVVDGNAQQGTAGQALAQPVRVRVVDDRGRPVPGQSVNFVVTSGNGTVSVATVTTNDDGIAAVQWTLGTSATAAQTLEARVAGPNGQALVSDPITATTRAGAPAKLVSAVPARPQGGSVGGPTLDSLAVRVLDQHDNPVAGADVQWAATEGGGSVSPTRSTTDANGIARAQWILGPNVNVVQGAVASVPGAGQASFFARAANAIAPVQGHNITVSGGTTITAAVTLGGGNAGPVPGVRVQWTVLSGGGSVSPVESISGQGQSLGIASTQWTLGTAGGTHTLRATAGTLQTTLTVTVIPQGTRNLLVQVPGRVLDAWPDRVLWLDSAGTQRLIKIRNVAAGTDAVVKVDTPSSFVREVRGRLFTGGALVWPQLQVGAPNSTPLFEYRNGTLTHLENTLGGPGVEGDWATWVTSSALTRRDLAAGTNVTVLNVAAYGEPGADGDVVYLLDDRTAGLYQNGIHTPLTFDGFATSNISVQTDGVNIVWTTFPPSLNTTQVYLDRPANDLLLAAGDAVYAALNGGWIAYNTGVGPVMRRSPAGITTQVSTTTTGNRLRALGPDGSLVYQYPNPDGRYFLVAPDGSLADVGASNGADRIEWRVDRFLLINGGSVYELRP